MNYLQRELINIRPDVRNELRCMADVVDLTLGQGGKAPEGMNIKGVRVVDGFATATNDFWVLGFETTLPDGHYLHRYYPAGEADTALGPYPDLWTEYVWKPQESHFSFADVSLAGIGRQVAPLTEEADKKTAMVLLSDGLYLRRKADILPLYEFDGPGGAIEQTHLSVLVVASLLEVVLRYWDPTGDVLWRAPFSPVQFRAQDDTLRLAVMPLRERIEVAESAAHKS